MADTPGSPPVKRVKTSGAVATTAVDTAEKKKKSVKATTEKVVAKGKQLVEKVEEAAASHGIAVEPIKAKAEKAAKKK